MAQNDQIQALIQEIDEVLSKTNPRLPWVMSTDAMRQRQVLEQARICLDKLQVPQGLDQAIDPEAKLLPSGQPAAESAQQVLQAVLQEMTYLRVNMLQPMRSDVDLLRQQREALTQEIRQLEAQRQQYGLPQGSPQLLMEFLQSAMGQMQESLRGQVTQMVASLSVEGTPEPPLLQGAGGSDLAIASLSPVQRLEQIQRVQTQSDQLLLKLDSTLQVIFDSLQNNILSYQESLEQGLTRMQSLGQQGEAMFSALVTRLAEQLGKEASVYLQSQVQPPSQSQVQPPSQSQVQPPSQPQVQPPSQPQIVEGDRLSAKGDSDENADAEIARLLEELNSLSPTSSPNSLLNSLDGRWQPQPFAQEVGSLEALDRELQQLDLAVIPLDIDQFSDDDNDLTFFQEDQEFPFSKLSSENLARIQDQDQVSTSSSQGFSHEAPSDSSFEDLESALDLLNQLSAESEGEPTEITPYLAESYGSLPTHSFKPDDILELEPDEQRSEGNAEGNSEENSEENSEAIAPPAAPSLIDSPDHLYTDDFYQSLFGDVKDKNLKILEPSNSTSDLGSHPADLQTPDLSSKVSEPNALSFELDTENALAPSLDLNEWFQEDVPTPQENTLQSQTHTPQDQSRSYEPIEASADLELDVALDASSSHEDIFGGAVDPAIAQPIQDAETDFLPDFSIAPFSQSVENLLLSEHPSLHESAVTPFNEPVEEDIFWELAEEMQTEVVVSSPSVAASVDTISALTDLISAHSALEPEIFESEKPETDNVWTIATSSDEISDRDPDAFEPAHPGEDLLIPASQEAIASFEVGEDTLQRLTADLSTLELSNAGSSLESDVAPQPMNREDKLNVDPLPELYVKAPFEGTDSQADQIASAITLEDLLFTDELDSFALDISPDANSDSSPGVNFLEAEQTVQLPTQPSDPQSVSPETSSSSGNAFTLEGLDILFEGVPSRLPSLEASTLETSKPEIPNFETPDPETQPKKKL